MRTIRHMWVGTSYHTSIRTLVYHFSALDGNQGGDPKRAAEVILDLIRGEGVAHGREVPNTLPLGSEALEMIGNVCKTTMETLEEWRNVIISTDIPNC